MPLSGSPYLKNPYHEKENSTNSPGHHSAHHAWSGSGHLHGNQTGSTNDTLFSDVLAEQDKRLDIAVRGLERSGRESDRERLNALRLAAADITEMRKKYHGDGS